MRMKLATGCLIALLSMTLSVARAQQAAEVIPEVIPNLVTPIADGKHASIGPLARGLVQHVAEERPAGNRYHRLRHINGQRT